MAAGLLPQCRIHIALAEGLASDQRLIGTHARGGIDVVALGFADQWIKDRARVILLTRQLFEPVDQGIFVGSVERVARLEGDHALPTLLTEQGARFTRRQDVLTVL